MLPAVLAEVGIGYRWTLLAALCVAAGTFPPVLPAQRTSVLSTTVVAGVGVASPLVVDGNGTTVRLAPAPTVAIHLTPHGWRVGPLDAGLVARLATASLHLRDGSERWSGGRFWQGDLLAQASTSWSDERVTLAAGAGATWLRAARRTSPLRRTTLTPAAEATVLIRPGAPRWGLAITAQGYRLEPEAGRSGGVARLVAGVTRDF